MGKNVAAPTAKRTTVNARAPMKSVFVRHDLVVTHAQIRLDRETEQTADNRLLNTETECRPVGV